VSRLSKDSVKHPWAKLLMQRYGEALMLTTNENSPEFGVAAADGDDAKAEAAKRLNHLASGQLTQLCHNVSGFSKISCNFGRSDKPKAAKSSPSKCRLSASSKLRTKSSRVSPCVNTATSKHST